MITSRQERDKCQKSVQDMRIKLIELESRRDRIKFKKTSGDDTTKELKDRQVKIDEEINSLEQRKIDLD